MKLIVFMLFSIPAWSQTVYDGQGNAVMRLSTQQGRLVEHTMDGTLLGSWRQEGGFLVHRAPNDDILEKIKK